MKTSKDPRHVRRIELIKLLYTYSFAGVLDEEIEDVVEALPGIDTAIRSVATEWRLEDMNKIDLAILRYGVFELQRKDVKANIIIDEAIEIAKEYGAENSSKFINAVLSKIANTL